MKVLDQGHHYELDSFDGGKPQYIRFMKRIGEKYPHNIGPAYPGTNCQDVLRALIDRVEYLDWQIPHLQNEVILGALRDALTAFEVRAAERHGRELFLSTIIEHEPTCRRCGHISCGCSIPSSDRGSQ